MKFNEIKPLEYPTNLLNKDWSKRVCGYRTEAPEDAFLEQINKFEVRDDDVWLVTLPKSGTTWMQELLWLVMNNFNFEMAKNMDLELRSPFFEFEADFSDDKNNLFKTIKELKSPRLIKSHLPLPLLPPQLWTKKPKTVYVFRNPKDAWVSFYHHVNCIKNDKNETLEEYINNLFESCILLNPPLEHAAEFYALRNESWIYYTSFERMKSNLREIINDICRFLNKSITEEQMETMLTHLSFEEMKKNPKTNHYWEFRKLSEAFNVPFVPPHFIREGKVGGHKAVLSPALIAKSDKYLEEESIRLNCTLNELLLLNEH